MDRRIRRWPTIMNSRRHIVILIIAGQVLLLAALIARQEQKLFSWQTIRLRVAPVDPSALFRGRYVNLAYEFSSIETAQGHWQEGDVIYLRMTPDPQGVWRLSGFGRTAERP